MKIYFKQQETTPPVCGCKGNLFLNYYKQKINFNNKSAKNG